MKPPSARDLFARALDLNEEDRETFLAEECEENAELRLEVQRLLVDSEKAQSFFSDDEAPPSGQRTSTPPTPRPRATGSGSHDAVLPVVLIRPSMRQQADGAGFLNGFEHGQRVDHDLTLQTLVMRFSGRAAQRVVEVHGSRWIYRFGDRVSARHADCRNTATFEFPGDQSDGLVTNGSDRHQYRDIDLVFQ